MNHIVLIGRLVRDPELRYTQGGKAVSNFDIAVNRPTGDSARKEADFFRIVVWDKPAESCANYLKKGRMVAIEGRVEFRSYELQDGQKRKATEVIAKHVQFLEKPKESQPEAVVPEKAGNASVSDINLDDLTF